MEASTKKQPRRRILRGGYPSDILKHVVGAQWEGWGAGVARRAGGEGLWIAFSFSGGRVDVHVFGNRSTTDCAVFDRFRTLLSLPLLCRVDGLPFSSSFQSVRLLISSPHGV